MQAQSYFALASRSSTVRAVRHGRTRLDRRIWIDDDGPFRPLGGTLFWALYGWHEGDRDRVHANIAHVSAAGFDSVRILAEVGWPGEVIDPRWADYDASLGSLLDAIYDTHGMRTELSIMGGGTGYDPVSLARRVADIIRGREHTILYAECANEFNGVTMEQMRLMVAILKQTGVLVAATNGEKTGHPTSVIMHETGADVATVHADRTWGDLGWRFVKQPFDWQSAPYAVAHNEPLGPLASCIGPDQQPTPLHLAMMRAMAILCGGGQWVLHNGAGVTGRVNPALNRPANLWEVPGIETVERAVRRVDQLLPDGIENWRKTNTWWSDNPLRVDNVWTDHGHAGVTCCRSAYAGDEFVSLPLGVRNVATFTARQACDVTAYDPLTLDKVMQRQLAPGQAFALTGPDSADAAYIVRGRFL